MNGCKGLNENWSIETNFGMDISAKEGHRYFVLATSVFLMELGYENLKEDVFLYSSRTSASKVHFNAVCWYFLVA